MSAGVDAEGAASAGVDECGGFACCCPGSESRGNGPFTAHRASERRRSEYRAGCESAKTCQAARRSYAGAQAVGRDLRSQCAGRDISDDGLVKRCTAIKTSCEAALLTFRAP